MQSTVELKLGPVLIRVNWFVVAGIVLIAAGLARLGIWQLDRASEKMALRAAMQQEQQKEAINIEEIILTRDGTIPNLHVTLAGEYINEKSFLLVPQSYNGELGFGVITPFRLQNSNRIVLVDRGWITVAAGVQLDFGLVVGPRQLTGQIHLRSSSPGSDERPDASSWPVQIRRLDVDALSEILGEDLFPYPVRLNEDQPGVLIRHWTAVTANSSANISYAIQWFVLAAAIVIVSLLTSSNIVSVLREKKIDP
ncbi:MAG: SURF1 family protein [Gammaproteobacteria bacterium]|nr:SURF1 family protein [Gammaproteobacteria bacterium]MBT5684460.1 SURF1 family protein [Gammaproteobacteria bacterium]